MRFAYILAAALSCAMAAVIFVVFIGVFLGLSEQLNLSKSSIGWILLSAAIVGGVVGAISGWDAQVVQQRRTAANHEVANELNLAFEESPVEVNWPVAIDNAVHDGARNAWLQRWQGRYAGLQLDVVDVRYTVRTSDGEGGGSSSTYEHTVYAWDLQPQCLPPVSLVYRGWGAAVASLFLGEGRIVGFDAASLSGIDAQTVAEFNRSYVVLAGSGAVDDVVARRIFVPDVMRMLLQMRRPRLVADEGQVAVWWPQRLSYGVERRERIEQTGRLVKTLVSANADMRAKLVPDDPNAKLRSAQSLIPLGCAIGLATPGFFLGGALGATIFFLQNQWLPPFAFPLIAFGMLFLFAALGWVLGKLGLKLWGTK